MNTRSYALRLADELEDMTCLWSPSVNRARVDKATAELRRLHQFSEDQIGRATAAEAALQMTKATHALKIAAVEAERAVLLEALKEITPSICHVSIVPEEKCAQCGRIARARAAIKAVEETK
jgi:hypothetical protein